MKPTKDLIYDPANAHHKYEKNKIALKKVYNEICIKGMHSLEYNDVISEASCSNYFNTKRQSKSNCGNRFTNNTSMYVSRQRGNK